MTRLTTSQQTSFRLGRHFLLLLVCAVCLCGCVRRRMTIRSNPPGAVVYVDDYEIGTTPISTNFVYYGTRKIRLAKDGYETLTVEQPIPAPWYQFPVIDFFAETVVPHEIRDQRTLNYQLVPQRVVPPDELRARAEDLRARAAGNGVIPTGAVMPPAVSTPAAPSSPGGPSGVVQPPPGSTYAPTTAPQLPPGSRPVTPPPTNLPPSMPPQGPGRQSLPPGGMPIR